MINIVLFGPPGAGKGTQAEYIIQKFQLVHLSTGDILRAERANGTKLGKEADHFIKKGELVPDEVVIGMIENKIDDNSNANGFVFDGFPRTIPQAEALDKLLEAKGTGISQMLSLEVEEEELKRRLLERGKVSGRRDDQNPEVIENRISVYERETSPVKDFYLEQSKHTGINGIGNIKSISDKISTEISKYL